MNPTIEQQQNFQTLCQGLYSLPDDYQHFDMSIFLKRNSVALNPLDANKRVYAGYQTSACALGHGPLFGIKADLVDKNWGGYCKRCFGLDWESLEAKYLFGDNWRSHYFQLSDGRSHVRKDNTTRGAAARIATFIFNGFEAPPVKEWGKYRALLE